MSVRCVLKLPSVREKGPRGSAQRRKASGRFEGRCDLNVGTSIMIRRMVCRDRRMSRERRTT